MEPHEEKDSRNKKLECMTGTLSEKEKNRKHGRKTAGRNGLGQARGGEWDGSIVTETTI